MTLKRPVPFRLYLITDRRLAGTGGLLEACERALSGADGFPPGSVALQLREKDLGGRELYEMAVPLCEVCRRRGALFLVNDRLDVAFTADADGAHLAANSFSVKDARRLLGPQRLIGVSAHNVAELKRAADDGADFAVFGPVFEPLSKGSWATPCDVAGFAEACRAVALPLYALGGVTAERVEPLLAAGAAGVGVIGAVFGSGDPAAATRSLLRSLYK